MDVAGMAERISSAASAPPPAADPTPAPTPTPAPDPTPAPSPAAAAPATPAPAEPTQDLQFDDDPPELTFDDDPAAQDAAPAAPAAPEKPEPQAESFDGLLPKQVENAFMATNRGRHLLATYKTIRELRAEPQVDDSGRNVGGLGFIPNADQIRQFHQSHSDMQAMEHEFSQNPQSFVTNWFAPDAQGNFREGAEQVLSSVPNVLDQIYNVAQQSGNEALQKRAVGMFRSVFTPMAMSYISGLYDRARGLQDPAQRDYYLNAARALEFDLTGKHRKDDELAPPKPEDMLDQRVREIDEREKRLNAWQTKQATEAQKATENEIFGSIDQNLVADVEKALSSVKASMSPRAFRAAVNDFKAEIQQAVRKDQARWRDFNFKLTAARSSRGADARTIPVQTYRQIARDAIQSRYRNVLQELATDQVAQNGARHLTAAAAAAQTAPSVNGGQSPPQSVLAEAKIARLPGEDSVDYNRRRLSAKLGSPN